MNISFKRTIALLIALHITSSPIQAIFESLILIKWKPDDNGKEIELFIIGDGHILNERPQSEKAQRDAKDTQLLQSALHNWNTIGDIAYLGESNAWIAKKNREVRQEKISSKYDGVYYTIPEYIENNNTQLSHIAFNMCDMRGPAFFETKKAIIILQRIFYALQAIAADPNLHFKTNTIEQNIASQLKKNSTVTAQEFLNELNNNVTTITQTIYKTKTLDRIVQQELENYVKLLNKGIAELEKFFNKQLNNDLTKSTFEAIIKQLQNKTHYNKRNQTKKTPTSHIIDKCLQELKTLNEKYEKLTNMVADMGFILALQKQKDTHREIVMFVGNNHSTAIFEYLNQYKDIGKANICFAQGTLEYQYTTYKSKLSHDQAHNLFCIPFNKNLISGLASSKKTKPYLCQNCPNINIVTRFQRCSRCKKSYYCSPNCQKNNWHLHKLNCKRVLPSIQEEKEEIHNVEIKPLPEQVIKNIPEQINELTRNESTLEKMGGPIIFGSLLVLKCLLYKK